MSKFIRDWDQRRYLAKVSGQVADNMHRACEFAATQARARAPFAEGTLKANVDIVVEVTARDETIEGRVGVRKKAFWAIFQELGTRFHAAQPFLRPAVFGNAARIVRILQGEE